MKTQTTIETGKVYVGTYSKYNEGSLFGEWLDLSDYADYDGFMDACKYLHKDEPDPELMFQDWENIPECFISESWISEKYWDYMEVLEDIYKPAAFAAYVSHMGYNLSKEDMTDIKSDFEEAYIGEFNSDEAFAENMAEDCGMIEKNVSWPYTCIDWEYAARELMYDYFDADGYYFSRI